MSKTMPRAEFDKLNVDDRQKFVAAGGTVVEAPVLNKLSRSEFDLLNPAERMKFIHRGGKIESPPPDPKGPAIADPKMITRSEFQAMPPAAQAAAMREGKKVVDGHRGAVSNAEEI